MLSERCGHHWLREADCGCRHRLSKLLLPLCRGRYVGKPPQHLLEGVSKRREVVPGPSRQTRVPHPGDRMQDCRAVEHRMCVVQADQLPCHFVQLDVRVLFGCHPDHFFGRLHPPVLR